MRHRAFNALAIVALSASLTACETWRPGTLAPGQSLNWRDQVRVTLTSGQVVSLLNARVERDTLVGPPLYGRVDSIARYPVSSVRLVELRKGNEGRTYVAVVLSGIGIAVLLVAVLLSSIRIDE